MVYTVDLGDPVFAEAPIPAAEAAARVRALPPATRLSPGWSRSRRLPTARSFVCGPPSGPQKIPRPQDLIRKALGLERPSFVLTREGFLTAEPASPPDLPV